MIIIKREHRSIFDYINQQSINIFLLPEILADKVFCAVNNNNNKNNDINNIIIIIVIIYQFIYQYFFRTTNQRYSQTKLLFSAQSLSSQTLRPASVPRPRMLRQRPPAAAAASSPALTSRARGYSLKICLS